MEVSIKKRLQVGSCSFCLQPHQSHFVYHIEGQGASVRVCRQCMGRLKVKIEKAEEKE